VQPWQVPKSRTYTPEEWEARLAPEPHEVTRAPSQPPQHPKSQIQGFAEATSQPVGIPSSLSLPLATFDCCKSKPMPARHQMSDILPVPVVPPPSPLYLTSTGFDNSPLKSTC